MRLFHALLLLPLFAAPAFAQTVTGTISGTVTANAGNQSSRGVDVQVGANPINQIAPYVSFEYLNSHTGSNIADINLAGLADYLPTNGKISPQAPEFQVALGLTYREGPFTAGVRLRGLRFLSDRRGRAIENVGERLRSFLVR